MEGLPHRNSPLRRSWRCAEGGDRDESGSTKETQSSPPSGLECKNYDVACRIQTEPLKIYQ